AFRAQCDSGIRRRPGLSRAIGAYAEANWDMAMEVILLPRPVGCLWIPLQIMTLGLMTLLLRSAEGKFTRRMDDQGGETRGGKRIAWADVVTVQKLRHVMGAEDHCRGSHLLLSQGTFFRSIRGGSRTLRNWRSTPCCA